MKRKRSIFLIGLLWVTPVSALDITAPQAPETARALIEDTPASLGEGLWHLLKAVIAKTQPEVIEAAGICLALIAAALLLSLLQSLSGQGKKTAEMIGGLCIAAVLFRPTRSLVTLGSQTVTEMSEYGKLLLPVMTSALAAQGGATRSAALYVGTSVFSSILSHLISGLLVPIISVYIALAVADSVTGEHALKKAKDLLRDCAIRTLKWGLYLFSGYMSLTGVISGTTDAAALKATKMTISGVVPVVGNILSEASETVLLSAGLVKNAAGVYGMLAVLAVFLGPFCKIGIQYLLLKFTAAICDIFSPLRISGLIQDFSGAMGILLATTGTVCLMLLISTACFMKGVSR